MDHEQDTNRERHAVWERAHRMGSPTHRLRTALVLRAVEDVGRRREAETRRTAERTVSRARDVSTVVSAGPGTCLDAGCGTGEFSVALARRGWLVTGFDPSPYAIEIARARAAHVAPAVRFGLGGVDDFETGSTYDLVLAVDVLEHIENDAAAMSRLASFLGRGGALVVTVPMDPALWSAADEFSGHFRRYTSESLAELAARSGLGVETMRTYGYPMTRLMWKMKSRAPEAESWVVESGGGGSVSRRVAAWSVSAAALGVTSIDRLFTRSRKGVGLLAVCRNPDR